ncbi:MAG TPA: Gfo/Idh/MocA family oxidoreductase [Haliscomenobacter sp.]|uniref:Gfo/Idh/MocA family protein n=1 Tax=Haliscomenobacter sp. TaxID=2717303 RepID=UPI002B96BE42|nr:Gfo/Idh/MocA family oxidoreductase [Haliscomenobacter sp.]HOY17187.1 Gfo/Idh/MocA family oxidoreductase [Haliscomenobacter sp.]HPH18866.1 Gfo/Idh/MocA family oxidoreductase [Haliscomenobacter sp.]
MSKTKKLSRRKFIEQSAVLGAATVVVPSLLQASANPVAPAKKVRVSIIGCGSVSTQYLPHISKSPHVELVSTCDIIPERAQKAAEQYGIKHWYPHIDQLLAGEPFDLLLNLTDMQEHGRLNKLALNAGRNVWSEKPMANTYAEGKALLDLAKSKGLRIWGAPAVVNSPQFAFMAEQIKAGKLGGVAAAHAHYGHLGPTWSAFFYEKGGGSLPDLGVYNLATLTGLLGPAKYITAMTSIVTPQRKTDNKGDIAVEAEDNAIVLMDHGKGIISSVQCGFNYFDPYGHEGKGQEKPTISIWGSGGNMNLIGYDWAPFGVDMATMENENTVRHVPDPGQYVWQMGATVIAEYMAGATGEPRIQAEHALHVLEVIEAARKAAKTGKRVKLVSTFRYPVI